MKKYQFWFTNNQDNFTEGREVTEKDREMLAESYFETDDIEHFVCMFDAIIENPVSMWYWVIVDGVIQISGAIDPGDNEYFEEIKDVAEYIESINR